MKLLLQFKLAAMLCLLCAVNNGWAQYVEDDDSTKTKKDTVIVKTEVVYKNAEDSFEDDPFHKKEWIKGVNTFIQLGRPTIFDVSPYVSKRLFPKDLFGFGLTYRYLAYATTDIKTHNFSARIFHQHYITSKVYSHVEIEALNLPQFTTDSLGQLQQDTRVLIPNIYMGLGYRLPLKNKKNGVHLLVMYNIHYKREDNTYLPYVYPYTFRLGIDF